jgi:hypothetical protein
MKCRTFCRGPDLKVRDVISAKRYTRLFELLDEEFGRLYHFQPSTRLNGGILMTRFPGSVGEPFDLKALIHYFPARTFSDYVKHSRWFWYDHYNDAPIPFYGRALYDEARFLAQGEEATTLLSTCGNAPPWTMEEVDLLARCLRVSGFEVGPLPPPGALSHDDARNVMVNFQGKASWE